MGEETRKPKGKRGSVEPCNASGGLPERKREVPGRATGCQAPTGHHSTGRQTAVSCT